MLKICAQKSQPLLHSYFYPFLNMNNHQCLPQHLLLSDLIWSQKKTTISLECLGSSPFLMRHKTFSTLSPPMPKLLTGSTPNCSKLGLRQKLETKESPMNVISLFRKVLSSRNFPCFSLHVNLPLEPSVLLNELKSLELAEWIALSFKVNL